MERGQQFFKREYEFGASFSGEDAQGRITSLEIHHPDGLESAEEHWPAEISGIGTTHPGQTRGALLTMFGMAHKLARGHLAPSYDLTAFGSRISQRAAALGLIYPHEDNPYSEANLYPHDTTGQVRDWGAAVAKNEHEYNMMDGVRISDEEAQSARAYAENLIRRLPKPQTDNLIRQVPRSLKGM